MNLCTPIEIELKHGFIHSCIGNDLIFQQSDVSLNQYYQYHHSFYNLNSNMKPTSDKNLIMFSFV